MEDTIAENTIHRFRKINGHLCCKMIFKKKLSVEGCADTIRMISGKGNLAFINNEGELG